MSGGKSAWGLRLATVGAILVVPVQAAPAEGASGARANGPGCWYYSESNFQGARAEIVGGVPAAGLGDGWNDRISSVACHPLCTLTAFDQADRTGMQKRFSGDVRYVGDAWNDRISALSVTCRRRVRGMN